MVIGVIICCVEFDCFVEICYCFVEMVGKMIDVVMIDIGNVVVWIDL